MQQIEMDSLLEGELAEGEQLLWFSQPDARRRHMASPSFVFLILSLVFGLVGIALLLVGVILLGTGHGDPTAKVSDASTALFITGAVFIFLALIYTILMFTLRISPQNTLYAITDRRAIIMRTGRLLTVDSYGKLDIGQIRRAERPDGSGDLIFAGSRSPLASGGSYGYSGGYSGYGYSSGSYGMGMFSAGRFIGIPNVRAAEKILIRTFK